MEKHKLSLKRNHSKLNNLKNTVNSSPLKKCSVKENAVVIKPVAEDGQKHEMGVLEDRSSLQVSDGKNSTNVESSNDSLSDFQITKPLTGNENPKRNCCFCGKELDASDSDHWKLCLQRFRNRSSDENSTEKTAACEILRCFVCQKNLSHMQFVARSQHMNRCLLKNKNDFLHDNDIVICPFCGKSLENKNRISHLKQCGKRNGFDGAGMLKILELLKRQAEEREALGLQNKIPVKPEKKSRNVRSVNNFIPESKQEEDLQMAIALSSSLQEERRRVCEMEEECLGISTVPTVFTAIMDAQKEIKKKPQKKFVNNSPLLLLRSETDRQQLVQQRVAAVLSTGCPEMMDKNQTDSACDVSRNVFSSVHSEALEEFIFPTTVLWNLSFLDTEEANDFTNYYVESLQPVVTPCKVKPGTKFWRFSQIPGRLATQGSVQKSVSKHEVSTNEATTDVIEHQGKHTSSNCSLVKMHSEEHLNILLTTPNEDQNQSCLLENQVIKDSINSSMVFPCRYSRSSANKLIEDLGMLVGNKDISDVQIQTKDSVLSAHSFLFYIRCPKLYQEIAHEKLKNGSNDCIQLNWSNVTSITALEYLRFIYTGHVIGANISRSEISYLIEKYEVPALENDAYMRINAHFKENTEKSTYHNFQHGSSASVGFQENVGAVDVTKCCDKQEDRCQNLQQEETTGLDGRIFSATEIQDKPGTCVLECESKHEMKSPVLTGQNIRHKSYRTSSSKRVENDLISCELKWEISGVKQSSTSPCFPSQGLHKSFSNNNVNYSYDGCVKKCDKSTDKLSTPSKPDYDRTDLFVSPFPAKHLDYHSDASTSTPLMKKPRRKPFTVRRRFSISSIKSKSSDADLNFFSQVREIIGSCGSGNKKSFNEMNNATFSSPNNCNSLCQLTKDNKSPVAVINISSDHEVFDENNCEESHINSDCNRLKDFQNLSMGHESEAINTSNHAVNGGSASPILIASPVISDCDEAAVIQNFVGDSGNNSDNSSCEADDCPLPPKSNDSALKVLPSAGTTLKHDCTSHIAEEEFEDNGCGDATFLSLCKISGFSNKAVDSCFEKVPTSNQRSENDAERRAYVVNKQAVARDNSTQFAKNTTPKIHTQKNIRKKMNEKKQKVSPMPDFDAMNTPHLQIKLKKIGVRQQKRKQAVKILQHVYECTHPLVTESENETSFEDVAKGLLQKQSKATKSLTQKPITDGPATHEDVLNSSQSSISTASSYSDRSLLPEEDILSSPEKGHCNEASGLLITKFYQFFTSNACLHRQILTYEPLDFEKLHKALMEAGIKHSKKELMDYLDEQGITFTVSKDRIKKRRCKSNKRYNKKRK